MRDRRGSTCACGSDVDAKAAAAHLRLALEHRSWRAVEAALETLTGERKQVERPR